MSVVSKFTSLLCLVCMFSASQSLAQSESPATVPASFVGTYELTFQSFNDNSPISSGTAVTLVIGSDNSLCVDGVTLTDPVFRNGNMVEGIWSDSDASLEYAVSNLTSTFNEVNVGGTGGSPFYGQLSGSKVNDNTDCESSSAPSSPVATEAINQIFALAESKLPEFFPSGAITLTFEQYIYRFYPETSVYLAFADDAVFLLGGAFGEAVVNIGPVSTVLSTLEAYEGEAAPGGSGGSVDLWTLTISGSFSTSLIQNLDFSGITVDSVPAPDLSNTDEINTEINSSLAGIASGISSISITVINNTENRRTFDVSFSATAVGGLGAVTYDLRYDYTR